MLFLRSKQTAGNETFATHLTNACLETSHPVHAWLAPLMESYRKSWEWKKEWYLENGWIEGENLFTTADDPDGGLDQTALTEVATSIQELM